MKTKIFITVILFIGVFYILNKHFYLDFPSKKFNPTEWKEKPSERKKMVEDIINSKMFIGKDTLFIENKLGIPHGGSNNKWNYLLGSRGILSVKFYILSFSIKDNIINDVYVKETKYD